MACGTSSFAGDNSSARRYFLEALHAQPAPDVSRAGIKFNEQYVVRTLLMYSSHFRVLFGSGYAFAVQPDLLREALHSPDGAYYGGGSLWIEKTA